MQGSPLRHAIFAASRTLFARLSAGDADRRSAFPGRQSHRCRVAVGVRRTTGGGAGLKGPTGRTARRSLIFLPRKIPAAPCPVSI